MQGNNNPQTGGQQGSNNTNNNQPPANKPGGTLSWSQPVAPNTQAQTPSSPQPAQNNNQNKPNIPPTPSQQKMTPKPTVVMNQPNNGGKGIWTFIAGLVVGLLIAWSWNAIHAPATNLNNGQDQDMADTGTTTMDEMSSTTASTSTPSMPNDNDNTSSATAPATTPVTNSSLVVPTTQPAGSSVTITSMNITQPTWIAVYSDNNGQPGGALGAELYFIGDTSGTIDLLKNTVAGQTYLVGGRIDDGSHTYTSSEQMLSDSSGKPILTQFTAN